MRSFQNLPMKANIVKMEQQYQESTNGKWSALEEKTSMDSGVVEENMETIQEDLPGGQARLRVSSLISPGKFVESHMSSVYSSELSSPTAKNTPNRKSNLTASPQTPKPQTPPTPTPVPKSRPTRQANLRKFSQLLRKKNTEQINSAPPTQLFHTKRVFSCPHLHSSDPANSQPQNLNAKRQSDFEILELLGKGFYSNVWLARRISTQD
jgi:hypothetical protein